jgi:PAS domain S-box-containing protein
MCVARREDGRILEANARLASLLGMPLEDLAASGVYALGLLDRERTQSFLDSHPSDGFVGEAEACIRSRNAGGAVRFLKTYARTLEFDGQDALACTFADVTEAGRARTFVRGQNRVLEGIARDAPLGEILDDLIHLIEGQYEGLLGSILLLEEDGLHLRHGAAPSLPSEYVKAIEGLSIEPGAGSCGAVMYSDRQVIVQDIGSDPQWKEYREVALGHGLKACWSTPIRSREGKVLGSFAIYYREARGPTVAEMALVDTAANLAGIAIERSLIQRALRDSEAKYRDLYSKSPVMLHSIDAEGRILSVSDRWLEAMGYSREEVLGRKSTDFLTPESRKKAQEVIIPEFRRTGKVDDVSYQFIRKDGQVLDIQISAVAEQDAKGAFVRSFAVLMDVTQRNRAEQALVRSEERFRNMVESISDVFFVTDRDAIFTYVSPAIEALSGYLPHEVIGRPYADLVHPDDGHILSEALERRLAGSPEFLEYRLLTKDGRSRWVRCSTQPTVEGGRVEGLRGVMVDIDSRKRAEEELRKSQLLLRNVLDSSMAVVTVKDMEGRYILANRRFHEINGTEPDRVLGRTDHDIFPRKRAEKIRRDDVRILARGKGEETEDGMTLADGEHSYLTMRIPLREESGRIYAICTMATDVTDLKRVESELRQSQKMEAIGRLAGGIAHDFNNLLTAINGYSSLALSMIEAGTPLQGYMQEILRSGERAAALTRQLLAYSRKQVMAPSILDLNAIVVDMQDLIRRLIGEDFVIRTDLAPDLKPVNVDRGQVEQILLNLVVNARDAMPRGGTLALATVNAVVQPGAEAARLEVSPGSFVRLTVSDTGAGMSPQVKARLFEPFFTTKGAGKGTGLGLSVVYGIVKQSGGGIEVESEVGKGSSFHIYLPQARVRTRAPEASEPPSMTARQSGHETVLLVEDEESVRQFVHLALQSLGYTVLTAANGMEALGVLDANRARVQLVITDVVMPVMGGDELAAEIRRMNLPLPILYISGYSEVRNREPREENRELFLQKPFSPAELAEKVRRALELAPAGSPIPGFY